MNQLETQEKTGPLGHALGLLMALPGKSKAKVIAGAKCIKKLAEDDPRRITHSLKLGLALTLVSLLYYVRPLYDGFGISGMWAVLTVVVVFEFTVGGTLSKCINRGFATLVAGALGFGAQHLASIFGKKGEPITLGILVFILAAASTFTRFIPQIKARYDYGVLIFILTFSLVSVSGYRTDELLAFAYQRLSTILIGGATCVIVSICIYPVWAGEKLHQSVASNLEKLSRYLEGFGDQYYRGEGVEESKNEKSYPQGYESVLNSKSAEEALANFAVWEPGHGKFRLRHPWQQYLMIGSLTRQCACRVEALNGFINNDAKGSSKVRTEIQESLTKMSRESGEALKALASAIKTMTVPSPAHFHVENSKAAIKDLKLALKAATSDNADILAIVPCATTASILMEIVDCVEKITDSVHELSIKAQFKSVEPTVSPEKPQFLHRGSIKPVAEVVITVNEASTDHSPEDKNTGLATKPINHVGVPF
ncbi:aluminum-activated malate transporter 8-like [Tripterygium wilfordii]|uniref:aluminum-activated malate transporter 8-like n=1 Tax=Tripterygium wilfordii TaxID=458696 RepID=UPI0018F81299|nr:aluminum-activated malate transporter 8-like [Tripterygium wilfordii]